MNKKSSPLNEKTLQAIRTNSKAMIDVEASERSGRSLADDKQRQLQNFLKQGSCVQVNSSQNSPFSALDDDDELIRKAQKVKAKCVTRKKHPIRNVKVQECIIGNSLASRETGADDQRKEIQNMNNKASEFALRGDEAMAIKLYKRTLTRCMHEVERIQKRMEMTATEPDYLKDTVYNLLRDEWTEIALIIAEIKTMMAVLYERTTDYDRAIKACTEAKDVYQRQRGRESKNRTKNFPNADVSYAMTMHMAEKLQEAKNTLENRKEGHKQALDIHEKIKKIKDYARREKLYSALFEKLSSVLSLEIETLGRHHPQVAETMTFLSKIHVEKNDSTTAIMVMQRATSVAEIALGSKHPQTGEKYYELARQFDNANRDKYDKAHALLYYKKALDTFKQAEGDHKRTIGSISNDLGVLLLQDGKYDDAVCKLKDALANYEACTKNDDDMFHAETAQVWRNLAECYAVQKKWKLATEKFSSALAVQRNARREFESVQTDQTLEMPFLIQDASIADSMKKLGKAYTALEEYDKAERILLEGLTIFQNACETFKSTSKTASPLKLAFKQDSIANIIFCIAEVKEASKKYQEAIHLYDESLTLRHFSDQARPKEMKLNNVHIAMCLAGIGRARMALGEHGMAYRAFTEAIQSTKEDNLPDDHPLIQMLLQKSAAATAGMTEDTNGRLLGFQVKPNKDEALSETTTSSDLSTVSESTNDFYSVDAENQPDFDSSFDELGIARKNCAPDFGIWFNANNRLEKRVLLKMKNGDTAGALEAQERIVDMRRDCLLKKQQEMKPRTKESQELAKSLVDVAKLHAQKGERKLAEDSFREALGLFKSSGIPKDDDCMLEIEVELARLGSDNKTSTNSDRKPFGNLTMDTQARPMRTQQSKTTFFRL